MKGENNVPIERLISFARRLKEGTEQTPAFNEECLRMGAFKTASR
ncbi:MAG: hypothetical protein ACLUR5_18305 [Eubacterium ventriosum]